MKQKSTESEASKFLGTVANCYIHCFVSKHSLQNRVLIKFMIISSW